MTIRNSCAWMLTALVGWGAEAGALTPVRFSTDYLEAFFAQLPPPSSLGETAASGFKINVVKSAAQNNLRKGRATKAVVEVRDRNNKPVAGALVLFALPGSGPSGTFAGAAQSLTVTTNAAGQAVATYTPNQLAGMFSVNVSAQVNGATVATAVVPQANIGAAVAAGAAGAGGGLSGTAIGIIAGVAAAAVGIGVGVAAGGNSSNPVTNPPTTAPPGIRIGGGGTPVFGPAIALPGARRTR